MGFDIHICGCRGSFPTFSNSFKGYGQDTSCYVIIDGEYAIIMDCGTGLYNAIPLIKNCKKIDILLSHVHYDHIMGLFDGEKIFKNRQITFYGLFNEWFCNKECKAKLYSSDDLMCGNKRQVTLYTKEKLSNGFEVKFRKALHGEDAMMIELYKDNIHIVYTGDFEYDNSFNIKDIVKDCDVLLFDGSYSKDEYRKYKGWGHSTFEDGCIIAKNNGVKKLVITHHSPFHDDDCLKKYESRAKLLFDKTEFAKQNGIIKL